MEKQKTNAINEEPSLHFFCRADSIPADEKTNYRSAAARIEAAWNEVALQH